MPTKPPAKKFAAWSYSRLGDYEQCPLRAKLKHLDRIQEPSSPAMERGAAVHKAAEAYVTGKLRRLPEELKLFKGKFAGLKKSKTVMAEKQWAFTATWQPCDWFSPSAWCRMVVDASVAEGDVLSIIDYKTGKIRAEEQRPQLSLYALGGFLMFPAVVDVKAEFWYLDAGETLGELIPRQSSDGLKTYWTQRVRALLRDTKFAPRPNDKCRWCHYSKAKAGLCKF